MTLEFTKCENCGIIFPNQDGKETLCPKCRHADAAGVSSRDLLRLVKNAIRDAQGRGVFLTISEMSSQTGIEEEVIWGFIHRGEIDTAGFNDPEVRTYIARRKLEKLQSVIKKLDGPAEPEPSKSTKPRSGLHFRREDDEG
jgi:hypothetical protein